MNDLTKQDWDVLDDAHEKMETRMLDWCEKVSQMEGRVEDIGDRYSITLGNVGMMVMVGKNRDKFFDSKKFLLQNLPTGYQSLYQLTKLNKTEIKAICKNGVPTQKMIMERRYALGLDEKPAKKLMAPSGKIDWSLVPATELHGLSDIGVLALQKQEKRILPMVDKMSNAATKETLKALVGIAKYNQVVIKALARSEAKKIVKERTDELDARERRLIAREKAVTQGINIKDKKLIQGILHPDKAPAGMHDRYAKAFDAFRKVA